MKITDVAFKLNTLETFIYSFEHEDSIIAEYIHGIIIDFIETDLDGAPIIVKINQISNLKDYLDGKEITFTAREFRLIHLEPFINYKNKF